MNKIPLKQPVEKENAQDQMSITATGDISYGGLTYQTVTMNNIEPAQNEEMKDEE